MDIKYTIEILTKDIQDIEKLVGKLQNSKDASAIELDLAMSKLRNVYEILTMIKADRLNDLVDKSLNGSPAAKPEPEPVVQPEPVPEPESVVLPEPEAVPEPESVVQPEPEAVAEPEPVTEPEPVVPPEPEPVAEPSSDATENKAPETLADKFQTESSINENLAETRGENLDAKLIGQPIDNISRNIGINDRFLIIRELFDGNSDGFSSLITRLDTAENYESASGLLEEHFADSMEHEGVEILAGLVKRRYLR
jgi:hypothetical protein